MTKNQALLLFPVIVVVWGINWTITKLIVETVPPIWSVSIRCLIAATGLLVIQLATKQYVTPKLRDFPAILIVGVLHMTIFALFMAIGLQYIPVGRSVILAYTMPLWVTPAAILFLKEPTNKLRLFGILLGIVGVAILCGPSLVDMESNNDFFGHTLLLAAALSWAIAIVSIKAIAWHCTPFQLAFWQNIVATILAAILALFIEGVPNFTLTPTLTWQLAYSGLISTAFGFWGMTAINRHLSAIITSLGLLATPIFGMFFSQYVLGEKIDMQLIIASTLIISGIGLGCIPIKKK